MEWTTAAVHMVLNLVQIPNSISVVEIKKLMLSKKPSNVPRLENVNPPLHRVQINRTRNILISAEDLVEPSVCKPQLVKLVQRLLRDSVMFQFAEVILSSILYFPAPFCRHPGFNS